MRNEGALRHEDFRAAYYLLGECSELGQSAEAWSAHLYRGLERLLGIHLGIFFEGGPAMAQGNEPIGNQDQVLVYGQPHRNVTGVMRDYWLYGGAKNDPTLPAWSTTRDAVATRARHELATDRSWYQSLAYNEFYARTQSDQMLLTRCPAQNNRALLMNFWRPRGLSAFDKREIALTHLLTTEIAGLLAEGRLRGLHARPGALPPRRRQVLAMLCQGLSERDIAAQLGISPHTVHNHIQALHKHFQASTHGQLLATAMHPGAAWRGGE